MDHEVEPLARCERVTGGLLKESLEPQEDTQTQFFSRMVTGSMMIFNYIFTKTDSVEFLGVATCFDCFGAA